MAGITGRNPYIGNMPYGQTMPGYQVPGYWGGYQQPQMMQPVQQPGQAAGNPQMSLPTVHADILQVADEDAMERQPVDAGTSQMMISKDETVIGIKSVLANGESTLDLYRKQPKAQKPAEPEYVTRAEFERRIAEMIRAEAETARKVKAATRREPVDIEEDDEEPRPAPRTRTTGGARG